jgi:ketosteroid isomerase-like protein
VEARGAEVWTFRDGKIMGMQGYGNRAEALEALGLSE